MYVIWHMGMRYAELHDHGYFYKRKNYFLVGGEKLVRIACLAKDHGL